MGFLITVGAILVGLFHASSLQHIQIGCSIFDPQGKQIRAYDGGRCVFFSDGRVVAADRRKIAMYDSFGATLWKHEMHTHHILTQTMNGDILVSSSDVVTWNNEPARVDVLHRIDVNGRIKNTFRFSEHPELIEGEPGIHPISFTWDKDAGIKADYELTHFNSYYEIPANPIAKKIAAFAEGNIVVNTISTGRIFILSPDLSKVLWTFDQRKYGFSAYIHDVQVRTNGNLLFYENMEIDKENSSLVEFDPLSMKTIWRYRANPPESFFALVCGGVQVLANGDVFYSDITDENEAHLVTRNDRLIQTFKFHSPKDAKGQLIGIQDAKLRELTQFLKHNRGL